MTEIRKDNENLKKLTWAVSSENSAPVKNDSIPFGGKQEFLVEQLQRGTREEVISQYIRWRKEKKMTQAQLAEQVNIPRTNITRFESGEYNPSLEMLVRVASALGMELEIKLKEIQ